MPPYTKATLQIALDDIQNGKSRSQASKEYKIPLSTLANHIADREKQSETHESRRLLSREEENRLCNWVLVEHKLGVYTTNKDIHELTEDFLIAHAIDDILEDNWVEKLLTRHLDLKRVRRNRIDSKWDKGDPAEVVGDYFRILSLPEIKDIRPENRYTVNEAGIIQGMGANGLVHGNLERKLAYSKNLDAELWTTIVESISATGKVLSPFVSVKGKKVKRYLLSRKPKILEDWHITATSTEFSSRIGMLIWLREVFIPQTKPDQPNEKRLLIVDGPRNYFGQAFMFNCFNNDIYVIIFPSCASHVLQPFKVPISGSVKQAYQSALSELASTDDTSQQGQEALLQCYSQARIAGITKENIQAGWEASGMWPINRNKPLYNPMLNEIPEQPNLPADDLSDGQLEVNMEKILLTKEARSEISRRLSSVDLDRTTRLILRKAAKRLDYLSKQTEIENSQYRELKKKVNKACQQDEIEQSSTDDEEEGSEFVNGENNRKRKLKKFIS